MQLLRGTVPRLQLLHQNQSFGTLQRATLGGSTSLASIGSTAYDTSRLRPHLGIRSCCHEGPLRSAANNSSSSLQHNKAAERAELSANVHEYSSYSSVKARRSSSHICRVLSNDGIEAHALSSALEAHALTQLPVDPSRHHDHFEPDPVKDEEAEGPFHLPLVKLRALLRSWDIDNNEIDYYQLLVVADYLERLGLDVYVRQEIKSILDRVFRIWTESSLSKTASLLGDLESVSLAFYLLRSHEYDVQPNIFHLYQKVDGSFCKRPQQTATNDNAPSADVGDLLNLLRASDLRFRGDVELKDAYKFASTTLSSMLDGRLSEKTSAEIRYRLKYPWGINFRMVETRETILNFQLESVTAKFPSGGLSPKVISLMLSTASQLFNDYISVFEREIENLKRWNKESGLHEVNIRPQMILLPFHLGLAYDMPQAKYAYTRDVWAKAWYLMIVQDDFYEGVNAASMEEILVFMEAFKKFDPSILEKLPLDERLKPMRVVYKAMYDVTKTWAENSSIWHGRDLLQTLIDTWMVRLEIYLNEKRWMESRYKFTIEQYMEEFAKWSFAAETGAPLAYYSIPGWKPSNAFLETRPDMDALFALSKTGRLLNDARTYQHEEVYDQGKAEIIHLLMEENPHLTEEDAVQLSIQYAQETLEEFTEAILRSRIPHHLVKQILLSNFRTTTLMYYHVDGLRSGDWLLGGKLMDPLPNLTNKN